MIKLDILLRAQPGPGWLALCIALIAGVAVIDYANGYELSVSILYLAPVFLSAWIFGRQAGVVMSIIAAVFWLLSVLFMNDVYVNPLIHVWDALILFFTLAIFAVIISMLKTALGHADERFVTVLEGLDAAVYVADEEGELLYANEPYRREFGDPGVPLRPPYPGKEGEVHDARRERWYFVQSRAIRWVDGRLVQLHLATDITGQKKMEERSRQQQERLQMTAQLITVGEMASTLAHELNQPLAAIANYNMGCVRRLRSGAWNAGELLAALEKSGKQAERAGRILQRARDLVSRREPRFAACDLNEVIAEVAAMTAIEAEKNSVRVVTDLAAGLPPVRADTVMIEQVVFNLVRNAVEAMRETAPGDRRLVIRTSAGTADTVEVAVADRGHGINPRIEENLFTLFFTTKPRGLGLGLHICRSIIEAHAGRLWFSRDPSGGSIFHFSLPIAPA